MARYGTHGRILIADLMRWNPATGHPAASRARELGIDGLLAGYLDA